MASEVGTDVPTLAVRTDGQTDKRVGRRAGPTGRGACGRVQDVAEFMGEKLGRRGHRPAGGLPPSPKGSGATEAGLWAGERRGPRGACKKSTWPGCVGRTAVGAGRTGLSEFESKGPGRVPQRQENQTRVGAIKQLLIRKPQAQNGVT